MNDYHEPVREAEDAGSRDAAVIAAILRIGASLDLDTVPRDAVDGARVLTGVRHAAIYAPTVPDSSLDFFTSGLAPEERGALAALPDELRHFQHLRGLAAPRRLPDLADCARSLRCSPVPLPVPCWVRQCTTGT